MPETMIERVARYLCAKSGTEPDELVYPPLMHGIPAAPRTGADRVPAWTFFAGQARDLLEVLREPTRMMAVRGDQEIDTYDSKDGDAAQLWRAMIDEALAEGGA